MPVGVIPLRGMGDLADGLVTVAGFNNSKIEGTTKPLADITALADGNPYWIGTGSLLYDKATQRHYFLPVDHALDAPVVFDDLLPLNLPFSVTVGTDDYEAQAFDFQGQGLEYSFDNPTKTLTLTFPASTEDIDYATLLARADAGLLEGTVLYKLASPAVNLRASSTSDIQRGCLRRTDGVPGAYYLRASSPHAANAFVPVTGLGGGVLTVTGDSVDNTDAANPVIDAIPYNAADITGGTVLQGSFPVTTAELVFEGVDVDSGWTRGLRGYDNALFIEGNGGAYTDLLSLVELDMTGATPSINIEASSATERNRLYGALGSGWTINADNIFGGTTTTIAVTPNGTIQFDSTVPDWTDALYGAPPDAGDMTNNTLVHKGYVDSVAGIPFAGNEFGPLITGPLVFEGNDGLINPRVHIQSTDTSDNTYIIGQTDDGFALFRQQTIDGTSGPFSDLRLSTTNAALSVYDGLGTQTTMNLSLAGVEFLVPAFSGGTGSVATGPHSFAFGTGADASGYGAVAFGSTALASGFGAFAAGNVTQAIGNQAAAFGNGNIVNGESSFAAGETNTIDGVRSASFGLNNTVSGDTSFAAGESNIVSAANSVAFCFQNEVSASFSTIIAGRDNEITASYASILAGREITAATAHTAYTSRLVIGAGLSPNTSTPTDSTDVSTSAPNEIWNDGTFAYWNLGGVSVARWLLATIW